MKNNQTYVLRRYILLNIYMEKWKPDTKIPSAKQLAIKFDLSIPTVKKELMHLKDSNILSAVERIGFFVNPFLYEILPLSLRKLYNLKVLNEEIKSTDEEFIITKKYSSDGRHADIIVKSYLESDIFKISKYNRKHTFMWNLAYNGIVITHFISSYHFYEHKGKKYIREIRTLFDDDKLLIAKEYIHIPINIWRGQKIITI